MASSAVDKNGKTEAQFLREYDVTRYFRPSVTVDAVLYEKRVHGLGILLIKRGGHPFIGDYAFPGGFVEAEEDCETAAARELNEETGIAGVPLEQLITVSTPGRDPRWRNITVVFCAEVAARLEAVGSDDAAAAVWFDADGDITETRAKLKLSAENGESFTAKLELARDAFGRIDINRTKITERGRLAFDHAKLIAYLLETKKGGKL